MHSVVGHVTDHVELSLVRHPCGPAAHPHVILRMHAISWLDLDLRSSGSIKPIGDRFNSDLSHGLVLAPQWARSRFLLLLGPDLVAVRQALKPQ